jgi:acyl-CoA synthetase (AMP-forming)/AMP-acid ligase II
MQIGSIIRRSALQFKDAPCISEGSRTVSFRQFDDLTDRLGNALRDLGLGQGDRVAVVLPNGIDCLVAYYALAKAGLVRVSLNMRETRDDHIYKLADSGSRAVVCADGIQFPEQEFSIDESKVKELIASARTGPCIFDRGLDESLRLGYTGGTTGRPKAVTLTTRGELAELLSFLSDLTPDMSRSDVFLHASPIAHASGAFFLPAVVRGVHSVVQKKFDPAEFLDLATRKKATMSFLVPTMLAMILEQPELENAKLQFRRIAYGASPISPSVLQRAEERFGRIFAQTYGQAESPMVITYLAPEHHDRIGSCGRPFSCVEVAIMDETGAFVPTCGVGEVVCRGPQLMAYYWNRPEATAEAFRGGWLHTGDIGRMDEDGFFYLLDRKNDMLISGGYNVYPREVEEVLLEFDGVTEAGVVGLPDEKWGDRIHGVVAGRESLSAPLLLEHARKRLAHFKCPKHIEIWPELPKSSANKILRRSIKERLVAQMAKETQK